jgi:hypothetical protein
MRKDEQIKIELDTVLEEYRSLKSEIVANLDSARQIVQLTLTTVAILIGLVPFILQFHATILFLIAPFLFYSLAWTQLRYIYLVIDMGNYLKKSLVPNVRRLLSEISQVKDRDFSEILSWELPGKGPLQLRGSLLRRLLFFPIAGANLGIPVLAATLSVIAFWMISIQGAVKLTPLEIGLILFNGIAFMYTGYWGLQAERRR